MPSLSIDTTLKKLREALGRYVEIPPARDIIVLSTEDFNKLRATTYSALRKEVKIADLRIISYNIEDKQYMCIIGDVDIAHVENTVELEESILHFLIMLGLSSANIKRNLNKDVAEEYLYPLISGEGEIDFHQVMNFFPSFICFEIDSNINVDPLYLRKVLISQIFNDPKYRHLSFSNEFMTELPIILEREFFDEFILEAYLAEKWIYCYLRLYRCLEPLFNNLIAKNLKQSLNLTDTVEDITKTLGSETLVVPDEKTSIARLFELLSDAAFEEFKRVLKIDENPDTKKSTIGRYIYKIRNKIVHHPRSSSSKKDIEDIDLNLKKITEEQWDHLCVCLLKAIYNFNIALT